MVAGDIDLSKIIPELNIKFEVDKANFNILKKSNITISGKGAFVGTDMPYILSGDFSIFRCDVLDEPTDFMGDSKIVKKEFQYLPKSNVSEEDSVVNFNINVNTLEPIRISNSLSDMSYLGTLQVTGGESKPFISGKVDLAPGNNKIFFKNNEYVLTKGNVYFYNKESFDNPELDFVASSNISDYKVNIKVFGHVDDFALEMSSEPPLAQSDVLSLIAFGYTDDISSGLSTAQRESITQVGVGSFIFDRLKINETLKNEFGVQINLGTELQQNDASYLGQVTGDSDVEGRISSATKVEVKKRLSESLDLSVSSTVGGVIGQRQSMNLNYNIDKNLSIEGVLEERTYDNSGVSITDESAGFDLKVRQSFSR